MTTYCLLDPTGVVTTLFGCAQAEPHQEGYIEVPIAGGQLGQKWDGTAFVTGPTPVPKSVTAYQAKVALVNAQLYDSVNTYMTTTAPMIDQLAWTNAITFNRNDQIISSLMGPLGLTSDQLDALFISANQISI